MKRSLALKTQFEYLASSSYNTAAFQELAMLYQTVRSEIDQMSDTGIFPLSDRHLHLLRDTYNRPIHILKPPALAGSALGDSLDTNKITKDYKRFLVNNFNKSLEKKKDKINKINNFSNEIFQKIILEYNGYVK